MAVPRFWRKFKNLYNLIGTRCEKCGRNYYPPRNICPTCKTSGIIVPLKFKGTGEIVTYTIMHSAAKGFEKQVPYVLAIVELDEGPKLTTQIVCDHSEMYNIHIGMKVKSVFRKLGEESERGMIYYGTKFAPRED